MKEEIWIQDCDMKEDSKNVLLWFSSSMLCPVAWEVGGWLGYFFFFTCLWFIVHGWIVYMKWMLIFMFQFSYCDC